MKRMERQEPMTSDSLITGFPYFARCNDRVYLLSQDVSPDDHPFYNMFICG